MRLTRKNFDEKLKGLLPVGETVLLAVSGGVDSLSMAELFLHSTLDCSFEVAHCNFHLRGKESDADAEFVHNWCSVNGVIFHPVSFDTLGEARRRGISVEMAARDLRYGWFGKIAAARGLYAVAVAHNANDSAETMVLNLLRGTGVRGLSGIKAESFADEKYGSYRIIRPLLSFERAEIEEFAKAFGLLHREDSTNADSRYRRNRVRNEIFPQFGLINPSFVETLSREAEYFSQAEEVLDGYYQDNITEVMCRNVVYPDKLCSKRHWKYLLFRILKQYGFDYGTIRSVENLLGQYAGGYVTTFSGKTFRSPEYALVTSSGKMVLRPLLDTVPSVRKATASDISPGCVMPGRLPVINEWDGDGYAYIPGEGRYEVSGRVFDVEVVANSELSSVIQKPGTIVLDADVCGFPLCIRKWQAGDRMKPLGLNGSKPVADILTGLGMDVEMKKDALLLVRHSGDIAAVLCVRISDDCRLTGRTTRVLRIREGLK